MSRPQGSNKKSDRKKNRFQTQFRDFRQSFSFSQFQVWPEDVVQIEKKIGDRGLLPPHGVSSLKVTSLLLSLEFMDWYLQWGNDFSADNSAAVDRILIIFFGRPSCNFDSDKMVKNQPSSASASALNLFCPHFIPWIMKIAVPEICIT